MHTTAAIQPARHPLLRVTPWRDAGASLAILRRELLVTLRGWRVALVVALMCALATFLLLDQWPPPETDLRAVGDAPVRILMTVSFVLLGASYLALPGLAANAILGERQKQTFELLRLSLIPPLWMVLAKLGNCVGLFGLFFAAAVPILAASFYLVGVDIQQFLAVLALLAVHVLAFSAANLALSAFAKRPFSAIAMSYMATALLSGIPAVVVFEYTDLFSEELVAWVCPPLAIGALLMSNQWTTAEFLITVPIQLTLFGVFFLLAMYLVRRPERVVQEKQVKVVDDPAILAARRKQFPFYLIDPLRRRPDIPDGKNPMRIKELRWGMLGRQTRMIRVCYVTLTVMFFTSLFMLFSVSAWVALQFAALVMLAPAFIASAVSKEYELGNMDLMRLTLLDGRALLHGKLWAGALSLAPFLLGLFVGGLPMLIAHLFVLDGISIGQVDTVLSSYPMLLAFTGVILGVGLLSSVLWRRTVAATVSSYLAAAGILLAAPAAVLLIRPETEQAVQSALFWTPLAFVLPSKITILGIVLAADGSRIALQCCVLACIALITVRIAEIYFVRRRMQDR